MIVKNLLNQSSKAPLIGERIRLALQLIEEQTQPQTVEQTKTPPPSVVVPDGDLTIQTDKVKLDAHAGVLYVDGQKIDGLDNHANILKQLVGWFINNGNERPSLELALNGIADLSRTGIKFK